MKNTFYLLLIAIIALTSCQDDDSTPATLELTGKALEYQTNKGLNNVLISSKIGELSDISDSLGNYNVSLDQNKSYDFIASLSGYYTTNIKIDAEKTDIENQIIWMSKIVQNKSTVRGFVRDEETGEALTNVKIFTLPATDVVFSNAYGYYEMLLSDGNYSINTEHETYTIYSEKIEINSPEIIEKNILLRRDGKGIEMLGKIIDDYTMQSIPGVKIYMNGNNEYMQTDDAGNFSCYFNKFGKNYFKIEYNSYESKIDSIFIPTIIDTLIISLSRLYNISGKVIYKKDNQPAKNVEILIKPFVSPKLTDNDGNFRFQLKKGNYQIYTQKEGFYPEIQSVNISSDLDNIDFALTEIDTSIFIKNQIVYYSFDENNADDKTENGLDGIINNEHSFVKGKFGNAIRVVGKGIEEPTGGHILMPNINFNDYPEFTINLWINEEGFSHPAGSPFFWVGNINFGSLYIAHMYKHKKDGIWGKKYLQFSVGSTNVSGEPAPLYIDEEILKINDWNMLTLSYKNGILKAYVNSELVGTLNQNLRIYSDNIGINRFWYDKNGTTISAARYIGSIDEFRIFKNELTENEIKELFKINKIK